MACLRIRKFWRLSTWKHDDDDDDEPLLGCEIIVNSAMDSINKRVVLFHRKSAETTISQVKIH